MHSHWVIWCAGGVLLVLLGGFLAAAEAVLRILPEGPISRLPSVPRSNELPGEFGSPRSLFLSILIAASSFARASGWCALCMAALIVARGTSHPSWVWLAIFVLPAAALEVIVRVVLANRPLGWAHRLPRAGRVILRLFGTSARILQGLVVQVARRLHPRSLAPRRAAGVDDAEALVRMKEGEGMLMPAEADVLDELLRLSHATVRHYMTPRVDVTFVEDGMSNDDVRQLLLKRQFVCAPVSGETPDEVLGLFDARLLPRLPEGMHFTEALLPPSFVPETMEASSLLAAFLKHRQQMAVVLDEFGGVEGVVTPGDFLEQILGGAAPRVDTSLYIEKLDNDRILASGGAHLDDLAGYLGFDPASGDVETLGGLIVQKLGYVPRVGASVGIGVWNAVVRAVSQKRVREVLLQRVESPEAGGGRE